MRHRSQLLAAAITASLALPGAAQAADATDTSGYGDAPETTQDCAGRDAVPSAANLATVRSATLCLVNQQRTSRGLVRLKPVTPLQSVASAYAKRMVRERFFDHTAPDGSSFLTRIKRTSYLSNGVRSWSVGENIAWGSGSLATAEEIVTAWMKSPGHRRNILNGRFDELGLGVALGAPEAGGIDDAATYVNEFGERHR